jgi:hypothetical protein
MNIVVENMHVGVRALRPFDIRNSAFGIRPVPPMTALRGSAFQKSEGTPQVASETRDNNANFAWVQHFIHHLAPQGMAGYVLANVSMSSNQSGEKETWLPP